MQHKNLEEEKNCQGEGSVYYSLYLVNFQGKLPYAKLKFWASTTKQIKLQFSARATLLFKSLWRLFVRQCVNFSTVHCTTKMDNFQGILDVDLFDNFIDQFIKEEVIEVDYLKETNNGRLNWTRIKLNKIELDNLKSYGPSLFDCSHSCHSRTNTFELIISA